MDLIPRRAQVWNAGIFPGRDNRIDFLETGTGGDR